VYVASQYRYEGIDSLQLNKHATSCAQLIVQDIICNGGKEPLTWCHETNAVAFCTWLVAFVDSLLYWEERSSQKTFVEILNPSHKFFVGKMLQYLPQTTRQKAMEIVLCSNNNKQEQASNNTVVVCVPGSLPHFDNPLSQRITKGLFAKALQKPKVVIREMELAMVTEEEDNGGRSKRRCRR
jgi:hypothetical protein